MKQLKIFFLFFLFVFFFLFFQEKTFATTGDPDTDPDACAYNCAAGDCTGASWPPCTCTGCPAPTSSFPPSTLIKTPVGPVKIEDLKVGDMVSSFKDNDILSSKISRIFKYERDFYYSLEADDKGNHKGYPYKVEASAEHPFYIGGGEFKVISKLKAGDTVYVLQNNKLVSKRVTSNTRIDKSTPVYNLTVDNTNTYFANDFAVHNKGGRVCNWSQVNCPAGGTRTNQVATVSCGSTGCPAPGTAQAVTGCCGEGKVDEDGVWYCGNQQVTTYSCCPPNTTPKETLVSGGTYTTAPSCSSAACNDGDDLYIGSGAVQSKECGWDCSFWDGEGDDQRCHPENRIWRNKTTTTCQERHIEYSCVPTCDPNVWGASTCTVNCGGGTQDRTNQCGTTETIACNTSACPAWTKLKDSSFISPNNLSNMIALAPAAYDADDTTDQYFIVGNDGVVAAPGITIDISNVTPTAKTGNPEYKVIYTPENYSLTPSSFLSYTKARKEYKVIADLNEITGSGIYVFNGDISISSNVNPFDQPYKVVLVVSGTVTVSSAPDNTFTPAGTAAIVASTINFDSAITEATGIFIGSTVSTGTNTTQGLKIIGNLIAQTTLSNNREWPTTTRPSVFIKFDQAKYLSLLPYLSTASYQWRQIQ